MATNYNSEGDFLTVTAPRALASGAGVQIGVAFGIAQQAAANGAQVVIATRGVHTLPKVSAQAWTAGAAIYWDDDAAGGAVATTATTAGNVLIGVAAAAAANPSATGLVRLNGSFPAAVAP